MENHLTLATTLHMAGCNSFFGRNFGGGCTFVLFIGIFSEGKQCIALFFRRFTLQLLKVFVTSDSCGKQDFGTIGQPKFKCTWTAFHSRGRSFGFVRSMGEGMHLGNTDKSI